MHSSSSNSPHNRTAQITAILGPTNTGKTHLAVERMMGYADGIIGLPLRLLAREIYERIVSVKGAANVALVTGEEKIIPPQAAYFVCTVEAMPLDRGFDFLAIDEIQGPSALRAWPSGNAVSGRRDHPPLDQAPNTRSILRLPSPIFETDL